MIRPEEHAAQLDQGFGPLGLRLQDSVTVASGYLHQCDPAGLVDAPSGLVYDSSSDTLFVASSDDNAVFAVPNASKVTASQGTGTIRILCTCTALWQWPWRPTDICW